MIIACCFSGIALTLLAFPESRKIDNINDLVNTNMRILCYNDSWIWWKFEDRRLYRLPLPENVDKIKNRIEFVPNSNEVLFFPSLLFF